MRTRTVMRSAAAALVLVIAGLSPAQTRREERPLRQPVRGVHGAVAAGSEWATEAGMRIYYKGGNAVDAGVATMLAASVTELSHYGMGGEAPILIRTKDGKVYSIAGIGTMPKLATADFFRAAGIHGRVSRKPAAGNDLHAACGDCHAAGEPAVQDILDPAARRREEETDMPIEVGAAA